MRFARLRSGRERAGAATARGKTAAALALLALAACAPTVVERGTEDTTPRIEETYLKETNLVAGDGATLPLRRWLPEEEPRAVILALHGMNDYAHAFALPAIDWQQDRIATYAYDQRGFGGALPRGRWAGVDAMTSDLRDAIRALRAEHPGVPIYVLGESMGGAVALAALDDPEGLDVSGLVLVAPAVWGRETMPAPYRVGLFLAAHSLPWLELGSAQVGRQPTDNLWVLREMARDPGVLKATRVDAVWGVVNLMDAALAGADDAHLPVLVLYGEKDRIIPRGPTLELIDRLPEERVSVALYEEGWHMLLRDLQGWRVAEDVAAWVGEPAAPLPSGADARDVRALLAQEAEEEPTD